MIEPKEPLEPSEPNEPNGPEALNSEKSKSAPLWFQPGYNFGYTLKAIDEHPWQTLITMKEILKLEPGSIEFMGQGCEAHQEFWLKELPAKISTGVKPIFMVDTTPVHPHSVESKPRKPFEPYVDRN